jgi:hypothetical protein
MHILQCNQDYGPTENSRDVLKMAQEGKFLDVLQRIYIYKAAKQKPI